MKKIKFIDLFSGLGGFRIGFEDSCKKKGYESACVLSSEIKNHAIKVYTDNFGKKNFSHDIKKIDNKDIPNFDILLAGFPCQSFSSAGNRKGFLDTRGTLFFEIERILKSKNPKGFILENVEGLIKHDLRKKTDKIGNTLKVILKSLEKLNYKVTWNLLNSKDFGLAQQRNRVFIVGTKKKFISLKNFNKKTEKFANIMDRNVKVEPTEFSNLLFKKFKPNELYGKAIKDKRGGSSNIHSWDIGLKGKVSKFQSDLLGDLLKLRRRKIWSKKNNLDWMDGTSLNINQIYSNYYQGDLFKKSFSKTELKKALDDLVQKGYLAFEHPKKLIKKRIKGKIYTYREQDKKKPKGYNIVVGKLSFEVSKIIDPNGITPTLLATDMDRIAVVDGRKIRKLTSNECKKLFGFPKNYKIKDIEMRKIYDLFGESIAVPVVKSVSLRLLEGLY